jgi:hypothetical protein
VGSLPGMLVAGIDAWLLLRVVVVVVNAAAVAGVEGSGGTGGRLLDAIVGGPPPGPYKVASELFVFCSAFRRLLLPLLPDTCVFLVEDILCVFRFTPRNQKKAPSAASNKRRVSETPRPIASLLFLLMGGVVAPTSLMQPTG